MDIAFYLRSKYLGQDAQTLIGISWHATAIVFGALKRILLLEQLAHALHASQVRLISLQYGPVDDDIDRLNRNSGIEVVCATEIDNQNDIDGLAALIMACKKWFLSINRRFIWRVRWAKRHMFCCPIPTIGTGGRHGLTAIGTRRFGCTVSKK